MDNQSQTSKLIASFASIYFIWGTTYLALRVAVESIPPFLLGAGRFLVAGTVLFAILTVSRVTWPTLRQWRSAFIISAFLFVGGNGLVTWAEKDIPSGIAALVVATMPLWISLFDWLLFGGPRPTIQTIGGMVLGFTGIIILIGPTELMNGSSEFKASAMIGLLLAPVFWSLGSLYSRTVDLPKNIFMTNAAEMLCGGVLLAALSLILKEHVGFSPADVTRESLMASVYLVIFGSMIALTAYAWLLQNAAPSKVATYSYVNPIIAVVLGWLILNEKVSERTLLAIVVILSGVILVVTDRSKKRDSSSKPVGEGETTVADEKLSENEVEHCSANS